MTRLPGCLRSHLAWLLIAALLAPAAQAQPPAAAPLDLRLPPSMASAAQHARHTVTRPRQTLQLEPRKSWLERGVEGSREALIECQRGAYPGATVAAYGQPAGTEAQPDHCRRF